MRTVTKPKYILVVLGDLKMVVPDGNFKLSFRFFFFLSSHDVLGCIPCHGSSPACCNPGATTIDRSGPGGLQSRLYWSRSKTPEQAFISAARVPWICPLQRRLQLTSPRGLLTDPRRQK